MPPTLRKSALTLHVACSVGWLGAAVAYLAVAASALASGEKASIQAVYPTLELLGWCVIVPLCGAALLSGVTQSLGTPWGLFRHYWVVAKLALTLAATGVLLGHLPAVSRAAASPFEPVVAVHRQGAMPASTVVHAGGGAVVLLAITAISVFKPWSLTPLGQHLLTKAARARTTVQGGN